MNQSFYENVFLSFLHRLFSDASHLSSKSSAHVHFFPFFSISLDLPIGVNTGQIRYMYVNRCFSELECLCRRQLPHVQHGIHPEKELNLTTVISLCYFRIMHFTTLRMLSSMKYCCLGVFRKDYFTK